MSIKDPAPFIEARLVEHEAFARGIDNYRELRVVDPVFGRWKADGNAVKTYTGWGVATARADGVSDHIAANDPEFVLAWVAAIRSTVEVLTAGRPAADASDLSAGHAAGYGRAAFDTLIRIATIWRNHPEYAALGIEEM